MNSELAPVGFGKIDAVVACGLLDVRERHSAVSIGYVQNLIKAGDRVPDMPGIGQRLFTLPRKSEDGVWQVTLRRELTVPFVRLPGRLRSCHGAAPCSFRLCLPFP